MRFAAPALALWLLGAGHATAVDGLDPDCVLRLAESGAPDLTLAELRRQCATGQAGLQHAPPGSVEQKDVPEGQEQPAPGLLSRRLEEDREAADRPFTVIPHRPNYFLAGAFNFEDWATDFDRDPAADPGYENKNVESQFQVSLKVPLAVRLFDGRMDLYGAYTNRSFWQVYNGTESEPFRETNHEPELWAQFRNDWTVFGFTNSVNAVGWAHQSNGRSGLQSRSWDRLYATIVFERDHWAVALKPWLWLVGDRKESDNPDIDDYMGHGELRVVYGRHGHVFSGMLRNQLESGFERGAVELSWSFPVFDYPYLRGYVQYFYGYGESLIDYDREVNRIGLGISVTDWLP